MADSLDSEIASLLDSVGTETDDGPVPGEADDADGGDESALNEAGYPEITRRFEDKPHAAFADPNYYKAAMSGEGDIAQRVHTVLQKYLNTKDPKDKGVFRQQLTTAFWDFIAAVAKKAPGKLSEPKKFLLRFNILHPTFLNPETRTLFSRIIVNNDLNQPVYYLDEWYKAIGTGVIRTSATDEAQGGGRSNAQVKLQQLLDKANGKRDGARALVKAKDDERAGMERMLKDRVGVILEHGAAEGLRDASACYTEGQKKTFAETQELLKNLLKADRELDMYLRDFRQADEDIRTIEGKLEEEGGAVEVDTQAIDTEYGTVRQMAKMTVGRQGNGFPILTGEYFHCGPNDLGCRENVISMLAKIESLDPGAFCRVYKNRQNRIAPYIILIPSYGDSGFCWEPFDRFNRATSRGRIAIPMYPKNLFIALLSGVADMRWQVAKEKASFYWMEEGLTGNYYQWFQKMKLKGDLKEMFIEDYITWMTKESDGIQKLDKEVRGIFWRLMPFSQDIKEKLKGRSFAYQELYQRDLNRTMSDGY